ncbi:MAG: cytochrome c biogenesis protein CcsA [Anaerolineae bacterium]|nr:cytochrome c biogenesis protein CcsA [Anaerolineae bacterium]
MALAGAWMAVALAFALLLAPTEAVMGAVQRIFYFHVSASWCGYVALLVAFIASLLYLSRREARWDGLALASSELGWVFITQGIVSGSIWAKAVWGTWWTWDPRLTTSAVLWMIYTSYLLLRGAVLEPNLRARLAAIYNLAGFVAVPLNFMAIRWWRAAHPLVLDGGGFRIAPGMLTALLVSVGAFSALYVTLLLLRLRVERLQDAIQSLRAR